MHTTLKRLVSTRARAIVFAALFIEGFTAGSTAARPQSTVEHAVVIVTSVEGQWRSQQRGRLDVLTKLEPGDTLTCKDGGALRLSANGVPMTHYCDGKPKTVALPPKPGLSSRWLASLVALGDRPKVAFRALVTRGEQEVAEEAVLVPGRDGLDVSNAVSRISASAFYARLDPVSSEESVAPIHPVQRGRLTVKGGFDTGLYRLQIVDRAKRPLGAPALVFVPLAENAAATAARFDEIVEITRAWPVEDAKNFRAYCLIALAGERR